MLGSDSHLAAGSDCHFPSLDSYVEAQMRRLHIPGASLAVVENGHIVHVRGFGRLRPGGEVPAPQTPFFIGSLTKSITALALMQLVEAGQVELDSPVQRYLPWFRVADRRASAQMTVRHLLNQTSGLPSLPGELLLADFDNHPQATERQARRLATLKLAHPVGQVCEYSNLNYNLLGLVIEAASGESYSDYIQGHIFTPLEMRHSYFSKAKARADGLAMGHRHWFGFPLPAPDLPVPRGSLPSGQLISCAEDMAHYLLAHLNGGRYGEAQLLSAAGMDELHRGVKEYVAMGISSGFYGMGWFESHLGPTKIYSHGGNVPDFSAFMALVPEQKKGFILLFNADPYGLPPITAEIGQNLTAILANQPPGPVRLDFIQWIMRLLPLIPLFQLTGILLTLRRRQVEPPQLPSRKRLGSRQLLLSLIPNLGLAGILVYLRSSGLLRFLDLFMPDLAWIARLSGGLGALRAGLVLRVMRK